MSFRPLAVESADLAEVKVIPASDAITLKGHAADVFVCSWNPTSPSLLASGYEMIYRTLIAKFSSTTDDGQP